MTAEIIELDCDTRLEVPVERVLKAAAETPMEIVIIIGRTDKGEMYFASSTPEAPEILWMIENAKGYILNPDRD